MLKCARQDDTVDLAPANADRQLCQDASRVLRRLDVRAHAVPLRCERCELEHKARASKPSQARDWG